MAAKSARKPASAPRVARAPAAPPRLRITIAGGDTLAVHYSDNQSQTLYLPNLPTHILTSLTAYGASRRLALAAAKARTPEAARRLIGEELARLVGGQWGQRAAAGTPRYGLLARAIAELRSLGIESAHAFVKGLSAVDRRVLLHAPEVRAVLARFAGQSEEGRVRTQRASELLAQAATQADNNAAQ